LLKYDTFAALLQGEGLADGAWFHIFPGGGDRLLYYQQKWVTGGTDAMADETRYQSKRNFQGAKRVFMLLPLETREHYVFVGAYDITSDARPEVPTPSGGTCFVVENSFNPAVLPDQLGRLVVEWRRPLRYRYLKADTAGGDLALVALRERRLGASDIAFPGFQDFHLTFAQLQQHAAVPLLAWKTALSKVAGVYAITDTAHGTTYIGSAYGTEGIWGRWMGYAATGHNHNALLRAHVETHGTQHLRFSVLLTMDLRSTKDEVIARESFFKVALGTRVHGLNGN
jgi:hypothetical protein